MPLRRVIKAEMFIKAPFFLLCCMSPLLDMLLHHAVKNGTCRITDGLRCSATEAGPLDYYCIYIRVAYGTCTPRSHFYDSQWRGAEKEGKAHVHHRGRVLT